VFEEPHLGVRLVMCPHGHASGDIDFRETRVYISHLV
jgi:hypothetical protein